MPSESTQKRPGKGPGIRASLTTLVAGRRWDLARLAVTSFAGGATEALFLVIVTRIAFAITEDGERIDVVAVRGVSLDAGVAIAFVLVLARMGLAIWGSWQSARLTSGVVAQTRRDLSRAFLAASWPVQQGDRVGQLQELLTTFTQRGSELVSSMTLAIASTCSLLALLAIAIVIDPVGALVMLVTVFVLGSALRPLRSAVRRRSQRSADAGMRFATSLSEVSQLGLEMHVFQIQSQTERRVDGLIQDTQETERRLSLVRALVPQIYTGLAYLALVGALAVVAVSNTSDVTSLGTVMLVMLRSLSYGQSIQSNTAHMTSTAPFVEALQSELARYKRGRQHDGGAPVGSVGQLELRQVTFSYVPGQPVLRDITFSIPPRDVVGIVGPSGGGKSTLVQLLLGLREPDAGEVLAGGRPLRSLSKQEWARKVTFVPQAPRLIAGTVAENIRFQRDGVSRGDVEDAARLAHLDEDIKGFPEGYDRHVGEQGGHLSGGQQQRLCLARALVEKPDVLILDEPTSALDVRSESLIRETLIALREEMTIIIIAHRLSTLDICDRIMVIQDGEMKGYDTPHNLERMSDFYQQVLVLSGLR